MSTIGTAHPTTCNLSSAWLSLVILPPVVLIWAWTSPPWLLMWTSAVAIYFGCKWLTLWNARALVRRGGVRRALAYFFLWPGMDAASFLDTALTPDAPQGDANLKEWATATAKMALGCSLLWGLVPLIPTSDGLLVGWTGLVALVLILHFGLFHLLALVWRGRGVAARPLMATPIYAVSLSEFWGRRWNLAFHDLAVTYIHRPLARPLGRRAALIVTFVLSGLVHDLVISLPARGGYGLPTLYFALQGVGSLVERSSWGRRLGLRRGWKGWLFTFAVTAGPVLLLFHPPFLRAVVLPFMEVIGAVRC